MSAARASLRERAERLRALHQGPEPLVLVNAWDAASAALVEAAGFPAVATSSAGVANSLGVPDGEALTREEMLGVVARIARTVRVPVTADVEAGYGTDAGAAAATARALLQADAVGMNLEDSRDRGARLFGLELQVERIRAVREVGAAGGVPIVINARTDVFQVAEVPAAQKVAETVRRGNAYLHAGADCVFVPFLYDAPTIGAVVRGIAGPVNILAVPGAPPLAELAGLGVRRVSLGSGPMRAAMGRLRRIARDIKAGGGYASFTEDAISYAEMQKLFENR
ncbi:MAG TPA: isocitrate lyase/phosphoenolpyruvate mutase family protein [Gemmatimonadales bacterium]